TDEHLVYFDVPGHLLKGSLLECQPDPVQEEPCRLLGDAERPVNLPGRDAVLGVRQHPDPGNPRAEPEGAVFHQRADLDGEPLLAALAMPRLPGGDEGMPLPAAVGAGDAFRPTDIHEELQGKFRVREMLNALLKRLRFFTGSGLLGWHSGSPE